MGNGYYAFTLKYNNPEQTEPFVENNFEFTHAGRIPGGGITNEYSCRDVMTSYYVEEYRKFLRTKFEGYDTDIYEEKDLFSKHHYNLFSLSFGPKGDIVTSAAAEAILKYITDNFISNPFIDLTRELQLQVSYPMMPRLISMLTYLLSYYSYEMLCNYSFPDLCACILSTKDPKLGKGGYSNLKTVLYLVRLFNNKKDTTKYSSETGPSNYVDNTHIDKAFSSEFDFLYDNIKEVIQEVYVNEINYVLNASGSSYFTGIEGLFYTKFKGDSSVKI